MRMRSALGAVCLLTAGVCALPGLLPGLPTDPFVGVARADAETDAVVARRVDRALRRQRTKGLRISLGVWDAGTGSLVHGHSVHERLRPASVMKLATTAAALLRLGPEHELATDVLVEWQRGGRGLFAAELVVRGGGDPGFSGRFHDGDRDAALRDLARQVAASGVRTVRGDLVLDDTAFAGPRRHPSWGHRPGKHDWWMAPVSALVLNDNCVDVEILPGRGIGAPALVRPMPSTGAVRFLNELTTVAGRKDHKIHFAAPDHRGRIPARGGVWTKSTGYTAPLACVHPVRFFGDVFRRALVAEGVTVEGKTIVRERTGTLTTEDPPNRGTSRERVATHATSVNDAVRVANTRSQNLFAEILLRRLGQVHGGIGSFEGGADVVRETFAFDVEDAEFHQADGSGLSRENAASAAAMGRILLRVYDSNQRLAFMRSLAQPGDGEGTLRSRFREDRFDGRVLAKTGTLRDTSSLAGYVRSTDGGVFAFAVLCEGDPSLSRRAQDAVVDALVGP